MATDTYFPTRLLADFNHEINRMLLQRADRFPATTAHDWTPAVDVRETDQAYCIEVEVPGVDPETIEITLDKGVVTLKGEREDRDTDANGRARHRERRYGVFVRRFSLPESADENQIDAQADHGVLQLVIRKKPQAEPRRISVRVGQASA